MESQAAAKPVGRFSTIRHSGGHGGGFTAPATTTRDQARASAGEREIPSRLARYAAAWLGTSNFDAMPFPQPFIRQIPGRLPTIGTRTLPMKFAMIDGDGAVTGFYDGSFPVPQGAVEISEEVWSDWLANQHERRWQDGALVTVALPPAPAAILAAKLAAGVAITSTGTPDINAIYALDHTTLDQIGSVARDAAAGLGLPGGLQNFTYPDMAGAPKALTSANVQAIYRAMRDLVFALETQEAVMAAGGTPQWPDQRATIA
jgi:hypothetical protein